MNPFDLPPSGAPVSVDEPVTDPSRPRRGRTVLVTLVTVGLVGGGIAGVSQLVSADRPDLAAASPDDQVDDTIAPVDDADDDADDADDESTNDEPVDDSSDETPDPAASTHDGQIVLDIGDGDPIVIDLGDLDLGRIGDLSECIGFPAFDADGGLGEFTPGDRRPGELPFDLEQMLDDLPFDVGELDGELPFDLGGFATDGGSVTVVGPDGVSMVDLGENGSVTVTSDDGEVTVSTSGDATVSDLDDVFGDLGSIFDGDEFDDFIGSLPAFDELPGFEPIDPDAVQECLDDVLG